MEIEPRLVQDGLVNFPLESLHYVVETEADLDTYPLALQMTCFHESADCAVGDVEIGRGLSNGEQAGRFGISIGTHKWSMVVNRGHFVNSAPQRIRGNRSRIGFAGTVPFGVCFFAALRICGSNDMLADEETIRWPEVADSCGSVWPNHGFETIMWPQVSGCKHNLAASASGFRREVHR